MSASSFAIVRTFVSINRILEFGFSFLSFLASAFSPICLVAGVVVFVGHPGLPAGYALPQGTIFFDDSGCLFIVA